jgi:ATP-binding cassette subfamily B protein
LNETTKKIKLNWKLVGEVLYGYKRYLFLAAAAVIFSILMQYTIPMVTSFTIDFIIGGEDVAMPAFIENMIHGLGGRDYLTSHLYLPALVIVGLTLLNGLFSFVRSRSVSFVSESSSKRLKDRLYEHLQLVPYDYHKHTNTGDLIQRCTSDVDTVRRFVSMQLMEIVRTVFLVIIASILMFSINVEVALISVSTMPLLCFISYYYFKKVRKHFQYSDEAEGVLSNTLQESLMGVRTVRAFGQQKSELDKFTEKNKTYRDVTQRMLNMLGYYWGGTDIICLSQILITSLVGIHLAVTTDTFTLGNVVLFSTYTGMLTWPVRQMGRVLSDFGKASVSMHRLDEILSAPVEAEPGAALTPEIKGNIVFDDVYFGYDYKDEVLKGISFSVNAGQTIGVLGATGSGKSSLVHLLQRLYPVTGGHIYIDGVDVNDIEYHHLREHISIVLQEPFLYSRSILDNIRITDPSASEQDVHKVARTAAVHDVILDFDKGYETMVGERGVTLSGGQQQRVAIARTLMRNSPILVFDDSMSAVDTETDLAIRKALGEKRGQNTTFIISHRITTLRESDLILVLDEGKIVQQGTHASLLEEEGIYRRITEIQSMNARVGDIAEMEEEV